MLQLHDIKASFPTTNGVMPVLDGITLTVEQGEFVSIIGPSGGGKSTLFNIVSGVQRPTHGKVLLNHADITGKRGQVAYMPQRDALLPWRSVLDNAVLATTVQRGDVAAAKREADALLPTFGLAGFGDALPATLSGGMRQRAALLRTVLWQHPLMLLDEPFGALDALTRSQLHTWLLGLWQQLDRTILLVTHDIDEALLLSDRVYVLTSRPARIAVEIQVDLPRPRSYQVITSPAFASYKLQVVQALAEPERG